MFAWLITDRPGFPGMLLLKESPAANHPCPCSEMPKEKDLRGSKYVFNGTFNAPVINFRDNNDLKLYASDDAKSTDLYIEMRGFLPAACAFLIVGSTVLQPR